MAPIGRRPALNRSFCAGPLRDETGLSRIRHRKENIDRAGHTGTPLLDNLPGLHSHRLGFLLRRA
jgi:hypothetical protein